MDQIYWRFPPAIMDTDFISHAQADMLTGSTQHACKLGKIATKLILHIVRG